MAAIPNWTYQQTQKNSNGMKSVISWHLIRTLLTKYVIIFRVFTDLFDWQNHTISCTSRRPTLWLVFMVTSSTKLPKHRWYLLKVSAGTVWRKADTRIYCKASITPMASTSGNGCLFLPRCCRLWQSFLLVSHLTWASLCKQRVVEPKKAYLNRKVMARRRKKFRAKKCSSGTDSRRSRPCI